MISLDEAPQGLPGLRQGRGEEVRHRPARHDGCLSRSVGSLARLQRRGDVPAAGPGLPGRQVEGAVHAGVACMHGTLCREGATWLLRDGALSRPRRHLVCYNAICILRTARIAAPWKYRHSFARDTRPTASAVTRWKVRKPMRRREPLQPPGLPNAGSRYTDVRSQPMQIQTVGIMMPGDMGHAVGRVLRDGGLRAITNLRGRSARTQERAAAAGIETVPDDATLVRQADADPGHPGAGPRACVGGTDGRRSAGRPERHSCMSTAMRSHPRRYAISARC